ncbi:cilia- and flagella-associated protein 46-like isoform X3 [Convolutriloba macropyga]|uniref:cilia- and flagella-associated protein 46-like isoform X3 n=1 Tax=Convolutriloba macropyga TaxID=536237 RepID=UPI003F527026
MDVKIRSLLALCDNNGQLLDEAFELLRSNESRPAVDGPDLFSHDLFVLCAEAAIQQGKILMARDALKMYFGRIPPQNQFLGRAYLAQAQLLAPESSENVEQLEKAVVFLLRAIKFAKENSRYYFIVYNASVLYWTFCRPFLRPGYKKFLAPSLLMVSRALDDTKDPDYEWRATLMISLIESLLEAGKFKDAIDVSTNAASFTKRYVPHLFKEVFRLQILHDLVELPFLYRASRQSGDLNCFYRLQKFRAKVNRGDFMSDPKGRLIKCLDQIMNRALDEEEDDEEESSISDAGKPKLGRKPASRPVAKVTKSKPGGGGGGGGGPFGGSASFHAYHESQLTLVEPEQQPTLLIDMFRLCMDQNYLDLAEMALNDLKTCSALSKANEVELEILDSELMLKKLGDNEESYRKDVIQLRQKLVERVEQALSNAVRLDDRDLVQAACTTLWNICLPLLQPNLRSFIRRPLTLIANTLEDIQSLLRLMRCQVHTELAKCEEDVEQNQVAIDHIKKAMLLDDEGQYIERHENSLERLEMRITLYDSPEDPLLLAAQIIEQAGSTGSGTMTMRRAHLMKAGQALSPDAFSLVIEAESFNKVLAASGAAGQIGVLALTQPLGTKAIHYNTYIEKTQGHLKRVGNEQDRIRVRLWADLAKTARKQGVWDICRVACRFCLLYDDGRWHMPKPPSDEKTSKRKGAEHLDAPAATDQGLKSASSGGGGGIGSAKSDGSNAGADGPPTDDKGASGSNANLDDDRRDSKKSTGDAMAALSAAQAAGRGGKSDDDDDDTIGSGAGISKSTLYDKDLLRILAETSFIYGEALVQLIRSEGLELNNMKSYPDDKSKRPKGYVPPRPDQDKNWIEYTNWMSRLHSLVTQSFLRASDIGVELKEQWLVQSAVAYLWNYNSHMLAANRHRELVEPYEHLYECLKQVGFDNKAPLLVNLCTALATGLISNWTPRPAARPNTASTIRIGSSGHKKPVGGGGQKGGGGGGGGAKKDESVKINIEPKGMEEIKKAIAICDFGIKVTNGEVAKNEVAISVRQPLLNVWVQAKQLASQSIGKGLGCDDDPPHHKKWEAADGSGAGQKLATRVMVAVEMFSLNSNGLFEFRECPSLNELYSMSAACKWSDRNIQVQIWARLACLAYDSRDFNLSVKCSEQAFQVEDDGWLLKLKRNDHFKFTVFYEMLSNAACLKGQCLRQLMHGNNPMRRQALEQFLNACRYAKKALNYELVMTAARHYWNTALPLVNSKLERELLQESLSTILKCINDTVDREKERLMGESLLKRLDLDNTKKQLQEASKSNEEQAEDNNLDTTRSQPPPTAAGKSEARSDPGRAPAVPPGGAAVSTQANILATLMQPSDTQKIGDPSEDLTLRAAMYGVLFLSYIDKKDFEGGLAAMDEAVNILPRTKHRLLVFKHRVMVKAKLGQNVSADIAKFKDESEDYVAYMWRRVALSSKKELEQLTSFQNSIEALTSATHDWQKVDYLFEFGEWLYVNEYPLQDSIDVFDWAINILLNMKFELPRIKTGRVASKKASKKSTVGGAKSTRSDVNSQSGDQSQLQAIKDQDPNASKVEDKLEELVSDDEEDDEADSFDAGQFIPILRKAEIGTNLINLSMTVENVNGINQLELLMRGHLMLAHVVGCRSKMYPYCVLMAHTCVMRIWQDCWSTLTGEKVTLMQGHRGKDEKGAVEKGASAKKKDGKKENTDKKKEEGGGGGKSEKGGKGGGGAVAGGGGGSRKTGPVESIPETFEDWSLYEMPENIRQLCQEDMSGFCINKLTLNKPMLTMYYLLTLVDHVRDLNLNYLAFPALSLARFIANEILEKESIAKIVRLKFITVCNEINLTSSANYHENIVGNLVIDEEEQAQVRTELSVLEEKLQQVMLEEQRMRQNRRVMIEKSNMTSNTKQLILQRHNTMSAASSVSSSAGAVDIPFGEPLVLSGRKIGDAVIHDNWIEMARFLIEQCQYQSARQFLSESNSAAKRYDDPGTRRKCLELLSLMALKEANPDQAMKLLDQAQGLGGDIDFWFSASNILLECILMKREDPERYSKARFLIHTALDEFEVVGTMQPNKLSVIEVMMAKLELKLALVEYEHIMMKPVRITATPSVSASGAGTRGISTMQPRIHGALIEVVRRLEKVAQVFNKARKFLDEIYTVLQICYLYRRFAEDCGGDEESRNDYLLKCQRLLRQECMKHQDEFQLIADLLSLPENEAYSLPYGRALGELQLLYCGVLLDLYHIHVNTEKRHTEMQRRKPSLVQFVEEFQRLDHTPASFEDEEDLGTVVKSVPHAVQSILHGALVNNQLSSSANSPFKAKVLLLSGKFYSLQGLLVSPDKVLQWQLQNMNILSLLNAESQAANSKKKGKDKEKESQGQLGGGGGGTGTAGTGTAGVTRDASTVSTSNQNAGALSIDQSNPVLGSKLELTMTKDQLDASMAQNVLGGLTDADGNLIDDDTLLEADNSGKDSELHKSRVERIMRDKKAFMHHSVLYAQSTELLSQSVQMALCCGDYSLAASAALEMVETVAQYDPNVASQYLALHQSCVVSIEARRLLEMANSDTSYSFLHALLRQNQLATEELQSAQAGALPNNIRQQLNTFEAWRRTQVKTNHFEFTKEYPSNVNFVVIQHSPDKKYIYLALLDKPKTVAPAKGKQASTTAEYCIGDSKARVYRVSVANSAASAGPKLSSLIERVDRYQVGMKTYYLQRESRMSQQSYQAKLLQSLDNGTARDAKSAADSQENKESRVTSPADGKLHLAAGGSRVGSNKSKSPVAHQVEFKDVKYDDEDEESLNKQGSKQDQDGEDGIDNADGSNSDADSDDWKEEEARQEALLQTEFEKILEDSEQYLSGVTQLLKNEFQSVSESLSNSSDPNFMVVLLADMELQRLPLEALALLRENRNISGFSRDFSLQMFHNRFSAEAGDETTEEGKDKKAKGEKAGGGGAGGKNTKTQKESKRPQVKVSPLDREVHPGYMGVDVNSMSYVVDPLKEASEYDEFKPETVMRKYLDDPVFSAKYLARWMGVIGGDKMPTKRRNRHRKEDYLTTGDWVEVLKDCNCFLYYGLENLFSYLSSDRLLPSCLSDCHLLILLDRVQSYPSYKRVSKDNVNKTEMQLQLECPVNMCMIMSLVGVGSIMMNQWFGKSQDNRNRLEAIMTHLIDQGVTTGQLHKLLCYPPVAATEKETQQATNSNTILELPEGTAKGGRGATPEADRTELKSGKSRDGAQSGKGNIKPPNTGSEKSRAASSAKKEKGDAATKAPSPIQQQQKQQVETPPVVYTNFNMTLYGLPSIILT